VGFAQERLKYTLKGIAMRIAALYDIHGNLPALEAVLEQVRAANVDAVVVGGDVLPGPMPRECLDRLTDLDVPVHFIRGNCELAILSQIAAGETGTPTYWGTTSGRSLPPELQENNRWTARQLSPELRQLIASWQKTITLVIAGLGQVLFCHATPFSETEIFTCLTPSDRLVPLFEPLGVSLVVCGHTHMQFDRMIGATRVVNAGSIGEPFGESGAHWLLLGPVVHFVHTSYDLTFAAERIRATNYPTADEYAKKVSEPPSEQDMLNLLGTAQIGRMTKK
jgi:predicted phosphodiesterase